MFVISRLSIWRVSNLRFPHIPETSVILKILYIHVENDLAQDSSIYSTCPWNPEQQLQRMAGSHEILGRLGWVCTSLQFELSSSLTFYDTDQGSYKVRSSF